jgi:acyl-CoA synthetase (AMP-forming)/AMP-acid ligase II
MALLLGSAIATAMYLDAKFAIRSDLVQIQSMLRMQKFIRERYDTHGEDDWSFYHILHSTYPLRETQGNSEAFLFEGRSWSYNAFRAEIGRIAEWFVKLGVRNRTVVGLFINNSPEFMFVWWALLKIGAIPAPINTGLTGEYIRHCVKICGANVLVCSLELYDTVVKTFWDGSESEVEAKTTSNDLGCSSIGHPSVPRLEQVVLYDYDTYSNPSELTSLPRGMVSLKHDELPPATPESSDFQISTRPKISPTCALVYLFTSGTTGLPKAATWPAGYSFLATCPGRWPGMQDVYRRFYICLPMFHGTAL